jgi:methyl-accepting chemotaxis protein
VMKAVHGCVGRFNDLSIAKKLMLCFALLAVGLVAVVLTGVNGMSSMSVAHADVVTSGMPKQVVAEETRAAASDMHFSETAYVLDGGAGRANYLADRQTVQTEFDRLVRLASGADDKPLIDADRTALARVDQGDARLWALVRAHRIADAVKLVEGAQNDAADALAAALTASQKNAAGDAAGQSAHFKSTESSARLVMIVVGALALLLGAAVALRLTRSIARRIKRMLAAADGIADGDVDQHVDVSCKDELGQAAAAFARMIDYLQGMATAAGRIAEGDLSVEVLPRGGRDALGNSFAAMIANLRELVGELSHAAGTVGAASQQMSSTSEEAGRATGEIANAVSEIAQGAERQVQMVEHAKHSAEEVGRAVTDAAETAQQTAHVAHEARTVAEQGVGAAEQANDAMRSVRDSSQEVSDAIRELADMSGQIGQIVATITTIAEQTNLLALNAAIEAARAGEQGRGFAVVAEEVRKLAEEAQGAGREISQLIATIQTKTSHAVEVVENGARRTRDGAVVVEQTREAFLQIGSSVDDITARIEQIAAISEQIAATAQSVQDNIGEVAAVAEQSSASTQEVSASTEQSSASAQQIAASAQELAGNAETLSHLVAQFKLTN